MSIADMENSIARPADIVADILRGRSIPASYNGVVSEVVSALEARDALIAEALMNEAEEQELDPSKVQPALISVGLMPALAPVPDLDDEEAPSMVSLDAFEAMAARIERLESIARQAGLMGRPVGD
jgi:hypothetical protein